MQGVDEEVKKDRKDYWFIGFKMDENEPEISFFILVLEGDKDVPVAYEGRLLCFKKESFLTYLSENFNLNLDEDELDEELDLICELGLTLTLLKDRSYDESAAIINTLNTLFDVIEHLKIEIDKDKLRALEKLADHLTFEREYGESYFMDDEVMRANIVETYVYAVGLIYLHSKFI